MILAIIVIFDVVYFTLVLAYWVAEKVAGWGR
jgi:hypothetical protein